MKDVQSYDPDLEMFREIPPPVNSARLRFLRWLAERGHLEHRPAGPPSGAFAEVAAVPALEAAA
jgi:hypothetical protein